MAISSDKIYVVVVINLISGTYYVHEDAFTTKFLAEEFVGQLDSSLLGLIRPINIVYKRS